LRLLFVIFLTLISLGVYWNTLSNDFVAGDRQFILRNPRLDDYQTALHSFTSDYWQNLSGESFIYYRPLTIISHCIDYKLYGLNPAGHHFSNMVFHTIVTLLVYQLFLYLFSSTPWIALVGAVLFALHPIHTHSVSYIMGRTDILAAFFYLCGLNLLIGTNHQKKGPIKGWKTVGACVCYFFSLLCKEMAITLPAIFFIYWFLWPPEHRSWKGSGFWTPFSFLSVTLIVYLLLRVIAVGLSDQEGVIFAWYSLWQRGCMVLITYGFYLGKLIFPLRLCYYSNLVVPGSWGEVISSPLLWGGILLVLFFLLSIKLAPRLSFALGWIVCTLLPVLNIIPIPHLAKENFLYIPSIGFSLLFAMIIKTGWFGKGNLYQIYRPLLLLLFILLTIFYTGATLRRNTDYKDPVIFLESTLRNMTPVPSLHNEDVRFYEGIKNFYVTHKNLGVLYQKRGQWEKSAQSFENALRYTPSYFSSEYAAAVKIKLGTVYEKMGHLEKAFQILQQARSLGSKPSQVDNLLGVISIKSGKKEQAEFYFKRAIQEDETYAPAHYNLGILYMEANLPQKGTQELSQAILLNPHYKKVLSDYDFFQNNTGQHTMMHEDKSP
jgi:hypothetical protein